MATWTTISNTEIAQDKPIKAETGLALRDNPIAIAEGASGAPRIEDAALDTTVTDAGRDWVRNRVLVNPAGAVGSFAFAAQTAIISRDFGDTVAGSGLIPADAGGQGLGSLSGTWRCLGRVRSSSTDANRTTLWLRIS